MVLQKKKIVEIKKGAYDSKILGAYSKNGNKAINLKIEVDDNLVVYSTIFLTNNDGSENSFGHARINEFFTITGLESTQTNDKNEFINFKNIEIGVLVDIKEYEGFRNVEIQNFYDIETGKTAYELENNLEAEYLDKKLLQMEA